MIGLLSRQKIPDNTCDWGSPNVENDVLHRAIAETINCCNRNRNSEDNRQYVWSILVIDHVYLFCNLL